MEYGFKAQAECVKRIPVLLSQTVSSQIDMEVFVGMIEKQGNKQNAKRLQIIAIDRQQNIQNIRLLNVRLFKVWYKYIVEVCI